MSLGEGLEREAVQLADPFNNEVDHESSCRAPFVKRERAGPNVSRHRDRLASKLMRKIKLPFMMFFNSGEALQRSPRSLIAPRYMMLVAKHVGAEARALGP